MPYMKTDAFKGHQVNVLKQSFIGLSGEKNKKCKLFLFSRDFIFSSPYSYYVSLTLLFTELLIISVP